MEYKTEEGFISSLTFNGKIYRGTIYRSKKEDAEQDVAKMAVEDYENSIKDTEMLEPGNAFVLIVNLYKYVQNSMKYFLTTLFATRC